MLLVAAIAGVLAALALADTPPATTTETTTTTTTSATDTTTTAPTGTVTTAPTTTAPTTTTIPTTTTTPTTVLPEGVRIGDVEVGGLAPADALAAVQQAFAAPIVLRYEHTRILIAPDLLGAVPAVRRALAKARVAAPYHAVRLSVNVNRARIATFVARVAKRFDREPVDARLLLRHFKPVITPSKLGTRLDAKVATTAIVSALQTNQRTPIVLQAERLQPAVPAKSFKAIVVIRRGSNHLLLYNGMRLVRTFGVATGQSVYPTPLGRFHVIVKWKDPWWYPPSSPWAAGEKPVPPGPGNPLGTRWMGISSPGVGIHGTPDAASIGYSASHGCIRMLIPDAEWLFERVDIDTPVFIVAA
jgi:lipoprotein-anchoring transpeptidase ErfK/SrfK